MIGLTKRKRERKMYNFDVAQLSTSDLVIIYQIRKMNF